MSLHPIADSFYKQIKKYDKFDPEFSSMIEELKTPQANKYIYDFLYVLIQIHSPSNIVHEVFHYHHDTEFKFLDDLNTTIIAGEFIHRLCHAIHRSTVDYVDIGNFLLLCTLNSNPITEWSGTLPYITDIKIDETNFKNSFNQGTVYHCIRTNLVDISFLGEIVDLYSHFNKKENIESLLADVYRSSFYTYEEKKIVDDIIQRSYNKRILLNKHG